ncbi:MAG: ATP-binding protein [Fermentimonas sp.]|nr:ATP-binding protein [Fermentimonas sp.]
MILEIKIKNFLSFKDEAIFSFEATNDKSMEDYQVVEVAPGVRILKLAVVYGANASGKSNLINVFVFLKDFWLEIPEDKDEKTGVIPFLLDKETPSQPSEFSLTFYIEGTKYLYTLELDSKKVCSEKLYFYPGTQPAKLFDRKLEGSVSEIIFNPERVKISQTAKDQIILKCLPNMSVLAAYNQVNISVPEIDVVINWIKTQVITPISPKSPLMSSAERLITKSGDLKKITNISSEEIEQGLPLSDGTIRTICLSSAIKDAVDKNAFLAIDEIESSLHPKLVEFIIEDFLKQPGQSQLLLTTHYDGLLAHDDLLRKDSIWFTGKKDNGSTDLYSLTEFKGLNRISSLMKAYQAGRFGAVPNL